jgi:Bacterial extracellular solute-binding protein
VPTWLSAVAALIALMFAAIAAVAARRTYLIESDRDRVNAQARLVQDAYLRRSQAALVSTWWSQRDGGAYVRNASDSPVYQAYLTVHDDAPGTTVKLDLPVIPPSGQPEMYPVQVREASLTSRRVSLTFTDASGVRWERDRYGRLTETDPSLLICAHPDVAGVLSSFAADMQAAYGVCVDFDTDAVEYGPRGTQLRARFARGGAEVLVAPHDWIGEFLAAAAVDEIPLPQTRRAAFRPWTLDAMSQHGSLYGIPIALDTMALVRNTELAPDPPTTMDELIKVGLRLKAAGRAQQIMAVMVGETGDPYQIWPLVSSSSGGWLFGRTPDGAWDPHSIGLARPETVAAFERIRQLGDTGLGILRRGTDDDAAADAFCRGDTAFLLATS